jgi:predicted nuclease of predicted toxin-antitoxin system
LLWDELLSPKVPQALRVLGFATTHVGSDDEVPARGSSDRMVLAFAQQANEIIVTSNHDMMLICAEVGQRFVWLDPRGRHYSRVEQVLLVFSQIERWEELLVTRPDGCVRSMRTKCELIAGGEAARLAQQRMRAIQRRQRDRRPPRPLGGLVPPGP